MIFNNFKNKVFDKPNPFKGLLGTANCLVIKSLCLANDFMKLGKEIQQYEWVRLFSQGQQQNNLYRKIICETYLPGENLNVCPIEIITLVSCLLKKKIKQETHYINNKNGLKIKV